MLARIHGVDYERVGPGRPGRPDGYLERRSRRWGQQWERSKSREIPAVEEVARLAALPESGPPTIVHGDYRLDNTMMARDDPGRIVAVLDWEMSTLGDPLADLGLFLSTGEARSAGHATGTAIGHGPATSRRTRSSSGTRSRAAARSTRSTGTWCSRPTSWRSSSRASTPGFRWGRPSVRASTRWVRPSSRSIDGALDQANQSSIPVAASSKG